MIIATQANRAISLRDDLPPQEHQCLASIPYDNVEVIVHSDDRLMPENRRSWRTFNMFVREGTDALPPDSAMCTVWVNRFDPHCQLHGNLFQTIRPLIDADPDKIVSRANLSRPAVTTASTQAIGFLNQLQRDRERRIWYCGSWAAVGIPLLESAVVSAKRIVDQIETCLNRQAFSEST